MLSPVRAVAQQSTKIYRIAFLHPSHPLADMTEAGSLNYYRAFFDELRRLGYRDGQNLRVHLNNSGFIILSGDVVHLEENFETTRCRP